jgi:DNA-binding transcriptional MerR regulator
MVKVKTLDIAEVSRETGLPASTLRYYEEKGLIRSVGRKGLKRLFDYTVLEQLGFIALGQQAGFALGEIADMFSKQGTYTVNRTQLLDKADDLEMKIKQLTIVRDGLRHAAECSAPSHKECPTFQRLIRYARKAAANGKLKDSRP